MFFKYILVDIFSHWKLLNIYTRFEGKNINERLKTYRTLVPDIKLLYLVYSVKAFLLEQNMLSRFTTVKLEINH